MYCSDRWWRERLGRDSVGVQRQPSEAQRERLAVIDPFFANFPRPLEAKDMQAEANKKRSHADDMGEGDEMAKTRARVEVLMRQIIDLEHRLEAQRELTAESERKRLDVQSNTNREKMARMNAERWEAEERDARSKELQIVQLERRGAELKATLLRLEEQASSRLDAVRKDERAKHNLAFQTTVKDMQRRFDEQLAAAVEQAKHDGAAEYAEYHLKLLELKKLRLTREQHHINA